jgi:hypothetical protein
LGDCAAGITVSFERERGRAVLIFTFFFLGTTVSFAENGGARFYGSSVALVRKLHAHHIGSYGVLVDQVCICIYTYAHIYIHLYVCMCVCLCVCVCVCVCVCARGRMYVCMYIHMCVHICIYIHTYIHTHIHTYIHTYTHTHTHTYIHTYIHVGGPVRQRPPTCMYVCMYQYANVHPHVCMYVPVRQRHGLELYLSKGRGRRLRHQHSFGELRVAHGWSCFTQLPSLQPKRGTCMCASCVYIRGLFTLN